jgi:hypothetical protein
MRGLPRQWRDSGVAHDRYEYDANANVTAIADLQEGVGGRTLGYDGLDVRREKALFSAGAKPARQLSLRPEAIEATVEATKRSKPLV